MNERARRRRHIPSREPLDYAIAAQRGLADAKAERGRAFLSAACAGWTQREIAAAVGLSLATVNRILFRAEDTP